jgi:hypothetical protein
MFRLGPSELSLSHDAFTHLKRNCLHLIQFGYMLVIQSLALAENWGLTERSQDGF